MVAMRAGQIRDGVERYLLGDMSVRSTAVVLWDVLRPRDGHPSLEFEWVWDGI